MHMWDEVYLDALHSLWAKELIKAYFLIFL